MKLILDPHLFVVFPTIRIAVLHGVLARPAPDSADLEKLDALRTSSLTKLKDAFPDVKSLDGDSRIELWKDTYKKMGVNPKKSKPTHWALASRLVKDGKWPRPIGPVIDVYLVNQINHLLPHGGYDMTTLSGHLRLSLSPGDEPFQPLGSTDASAEKTKKGEVVYHDDVRVLTRSWNYRDSEPTKIAEPTTDFAIFIEDTSGSESGAEALEKAIQDLKGLYEEVFGKKGEGEGAFVGHTAVWSFQEGKTEVESDW